MAPGLSVVDATPGGAPVEAPASPLPPDVAKAFARLEKAHAAWTRGGAAISVSNATAQGTARASFRLDLDGTGGATLRVKNPGDKSLAATDQAFILRRNRVLGIDFVARESLLRPAPDRGTLGLRLAAVLGGIDDSVGFLTSTETREKYLGPIRSLSGWKVVPGGLVRRAGSSDTRLDLDAGGRLKGLHIAFPGSRLDWKIAYGPAVALAVPRDLRPVEAFTARLRPPRYADADAKRVVEAVLGAGGRLRSAIVRIDGAATLWVDDSRVRYEADGAGYAYDGRTLTVVKDGTAYQGRASRGAVIDHAATILGSVDPLARSVLVRTPVYGEIFTPESRVRLVGTMAFAGQPCDLLAIDSPRYRASMFVRKADHLPVSIETEALDAQGRALAKTTRTLAWSSVGAPLEKSLFALRLKPGQAVLPLPNRAARP